VLTDEELDRAEDVLGHRFGNRALLSRALTHASLVDARLQSNERLEFLGDAVLGMVVCEFLFEKYPDLLEGEMTKIKSTVVSRTMCAVIAERLALGDLLRLGKGMINRSTLPRSVTAAVLESVIGALYLDGGLEVARSFIVSHFGEDIHECFRSGHQSNFKSVLQQAAQQIFDQAPLYCVLDEKGPDHAKCFEICVDIGGRRFPSCWGATKKQAEQDAALAALVELELAEVAADGEVRVLDPEVLLLRDRLHRLNGDFSPLDEGGPRVLDFDRDPD